MPCEYIKYMIVMISCFGAAVSDFSRFYFMFNVKPTAQSKKKVRSALPVVFVLYFDLFDVLIAFLLSEIYMLAMYTPELRYQMFHKSTLEAYGV